MHPLLRRYDGVHLGALSRDRHQATVRVLGELDAAFDLRDIDAESLRAAMDGWAAVHSPATLRKARAIVLAFCSWAWREGEISAETLLELRSTRPPIATIGRAAPQPYRPGELRTLRATLDTRWPKLPDREAWHWLRRWLDGRSPYSRVRTHMIRCQLDAVIALALYCGLRRREIFALDRHAMHDDNAYVVVWGKSGRCGDDYRTVPYTDSGRAQVAPWCRLRTVLGTEHTHAWLNLHAEPTAREPMSRDTFNKLLRTYVGAGWTLARLRATCGVAWAKTGLLPEHLRQVLGYSSIGDVLPYMALVGGDVERQMNGRDAAFAEQVEAAAW
jgi:integrase